MKLIHRRTILAGRKHSRERSQYSENKTCSSIPVIPNTLKFPFNQQPPKLVEALRRETPLQSPDSDFLLSLLSRQVS